MQEPILNEETTTTLIEQAMVKSPEFADKMEYWLVKRRRMPSQGWLLLRLIEALGYDRISYVIGKGVHDKTDK